MLGTPGGGELGGGLVAKRAVRPALVVVGAPSTDDLACFGERAEPVLVQALVAELAVEALHIRVLRRLAGQYQAQRFPAVVGPAVECIASELLALIGAQHTRQTPEGADPVQHPRYILARNAMIDRDVGGFFRVVIDSCSHRR